MPTIKSIGSISSIVCPFQFYQSQEHLQVCQKYRQLDVQDLLGKRCMLRTKMEVLNRAVIRRWYTLFELAFPLRKYEIDKLDARQIDILKGWFVTLLGLISAQSRHFLSRYVIHLHLDPRIQDSVKYFV